LTPHISRKRLFRNVLKRNFNPQLSRSKLKREAPARGERAKCLPLKEQHLKQCPIRAVHGGDAGVAVAGDALGRNRQSHRRNPLQF
jgi:hypothetical protein